MSDLVGKTIAEVREREYGEWLMIFTDGSAVMLHPEGYEADGIRAETVDVAAIEAQDAARVREEEQRRRWARERAAEVEAKRAELGPADFLAWMDANRPGWRVNETLRRTFLPAIECEIRAGHEMMTRAMNRQTYGSALAEIPTKEPE